MDIQKKIFQGKGESISDMFFFECSGRETQPSMSGGYRGEGSGGRERVESDKIREESYLDGEAPIGSEKGEKHDLTV